jgi:Protein of unknown function (DUF3311)
VSEPMSSTPGSGGDADRQANVGLRWSPWNLLLLVPFLMLVTPWFNSVEPRLFGMPFFYWAQFAFVPVGVLCVAAVYLRTRDEPVPDAVGEPPDVDELDEGALGRGGAR